MEVEHRLDKAFQVLWEKLEALLFPSPPEKEPETRPRTHPSRLKRKPAQTSQAPNRRVERNQLRQQASKMEAQASTDDSQSRGNKLLQKSMQLKRKHGTTHQPRTVRPGQCRYQRQP
ncbi:Hypothetical predicted protein [Pelobates cultripes]|uniref:Uncharacterized protein n=1 Tax=Pelobates cultripes TaxID=61616 RepID=A0AAD1WN97_PELCU|nr:Hypothetical predicted protein [Pelobates cultripes]